MPDQIFSTHLPFYLASSSARRKQLLSSVGLPFKVATSSFVERPPLPHEHPKDYARTMAWGKTHAVIVDIPGIILGADTVVALDGEIMGKPPTAEAALEMLEKLNGNQHQVYTGVCLLPPEKPAMEVVISTRVSFQKWPREALIAYVKTGEPLDKAGGYGIQDRGSFLVRTIEGSVSNVIGLPLAETLETLLAHNLIFPVSSGS